MNERRRSEFRKSNEFKKWKVGSSNLANNRGFQDGPVAPGEDCIEETIVKRELS